MNLLLRIMLVLALVLPVWAQTTFTNPIKTGDAPDPHVYYSNGFYYGCYTTGGDIRIWKNANLHQIFQGPSASVYSGRDLWAPEIHFLNGKWYIYSTTHPGNYWFNTIVLEANTADPLGSYSLKATFSGLSNTIDASPWQDPATGQLYLTYSKMDGAAGQEIWLTKMSNPYTLEGSPVRLSWPDYAWEKENGNVNEGPQFLAKGDKVHIVYSASQCHYEGYKLGMLTITAGGNLMDPGAWSKSAVSVFQKNPANNAYAVGHHSTVQTPNGEWWLVYHGKYDSNKNTVNSPRDARMQSFTWNGNVPNFGVPVATGTALAIPGSGSPVLIEPATHWEFDSGLEGWNGPNNMTATASGGVLSMSISGGDPFIYSPDNLALDMSKFNQVIVRMKNQTTSTSAQLYWATTAATGFDNAKSTGFTIVANDNALRDYVVNLSGKNAWTGTLKQIRLDPEAGATTGSSQVDFVRISGNFSGSPISIPGVLEFEDYNLGGEGNAYHETESANLGGAYRTSEGVDIQGTSDAGGGNNIGWLDAGEWLDYTINVAQDGLYDLDIRSAASTTGNVIHIESNGVNVSGAISVSNTGGIQTWATVKTSCTLKAGLQRLRLVVDQSSGGFNLNKITFSKQAPTWVSPSRPPLNATSQPKLYNLLGRWLGR